MPLIYAPVGQDLPIVHISGKPDVRRHLQEMGFVKGETLRIVSHMGGNMIVVVKETRVAIDRELAANILV